jgi:glycosyltransferase involved in cell wall biosynthesis
VAAYRRKLEAVAARAEVDRLVAVTGSEWREPDGRRIAFESSAKSDAYDLRVEPLWLNGSYHLFIWPRLGRLIREVRPDLVHIDEEPYNLATAHGTWLAQRAGARSLFFTWQNLLRRYPPPFNLFERSVFAHSAFGIAGSQEALEVVRKKGYCGPAAVIPQFGVDPDLFSPGGRTPDGPPVIGYMSRLVEEKGLLVLLDALAQVRGDWCLHVIGSGPLEGAARRRAEQLGIGNRITWERGIASMLVPERLRKFTLFVQPSLTRRHWKEQFGRAVVEAMACGVPVIGSDSAEIPQVLDDAGLIVPEGDAAALRHAIERVLADEALRRDMAVRGRQRVLDCYTHGRIAEQTVAAYRAATMQ